MKTIPATHVEVGFRSLDLPLLYVVMVGVDRALRVEFSGEQCSDARCAVSFCKTLLLLFQD